MPSIKGEDDHLVCTDKCSIRYFIFRLSLSIIAIPYLIGFLRAAEPDLSEDERIEEMIVDVQDPIDLHLIEGKAFRALLLQIFVH